MKQQILEIAMTVKESGDYDNYMKEMSSSVESKESTLGIQN